MERKERTHNMQVIFFYFTSFSNLHCPPISKMKPSSTGLEPPTMMLLMGMWINFTKKPMKPIIANPTAIFQNSFRLGLVDQLTSQVESFTNCRLGSTNCITWSMTHSTGRICFLGIIFSSYNLSISFWSWSPMGLSWSLMWTQQALAIDMVPQTDR